MRQDPARALPGPVVAAVAHGGLLALVAATSRASVLSGYVQAAAELGLDHGSPVSAARLPHNSTLDARKSTVLRV